MDPPVFSSKGENLVVVMRIFLRVDHETHVIFESKMSQTAADAIVTHQFWTQNGQFAPNMNIFEKTVNAILIFVHRHED